jgi:Do/DeqQ family serine protease
MLNNRYRWLFYILIFLLGFGSGGMFFYWLIKTEIQKYATSNHNASVIFPVAGSYSAASSVNAPPSSVQFENAADSAINSVVNISTLIGDNDFFSLKDLLGGKVKGSGSGVIISQDGYIITNNHVIDNASQIVVTLNDNSEFIAKIVAQDPNTDLAVIKIDAQNLTPIKIGNSDNVKIGEWVLAVGNPFNLNSTVTAGIVSAKARNIGILRNHLNSKYGNDYSIESFIQTDAAVNPGNSGGALINLAGELIGINTAIATETGSYAGYSFAIPVNLAKKVVMDLITYGAVQRGFIGVSIRDLDAKLAKEYQFPTKQGAFIVGLTPNGAAKYAGLQEGDLIIGIENKIIRSASELQEQIANFRPGDQIQVTYIRKGQKQTTQVALRNAKGGLGLVEAKTETQIYFEKLGIALSEINVKEREKFGLNFGVKITQITKEGPFHNLGISEDFIIYKINGKIVKSISQVYLQLVHAQDPIILEGYLPNGAKAKFKYTPKTDVL